MEKDRIYLAQGSEGSSKQAEMPSITALEGGDLLLFSVPGEDVRAQKRMQWNGEEILVALTQTRDCFVSLPTTCKALGLNPRGQLQRIQRTPALQVGLRQLPLSTRGGLQRLNCLHTDLVASWLAGMHNRMLTDDLRQQIEGYSTRLAETEQLLRLLATGSSLIEIEIDPQPQQQIQEPHPSPAQVEINPVSETALTIAESDISLVVDLDEAQIVEEPLLEEKETPDVAEDLVQQSWLLQDDSPFDGSDDQQKQQALLTTLPGINTAAILVTTGYQEDRAIREATLARKADWEEEPVSQRMRYIASNKLHIYLGDPEHPLSLVETNNVIRALGESTVLTARILLGLWNIRRAEHQLTKDGSAAIRIDDILEWRGVQKHQRTLYSGTQKRSTDGYQWKHKQQVHRDIKLLELCHLRGIHMVTIKGKARQFSVDGPYLRVTSVKETTTAQKEDIIGYFIAPGAWINTYEEHGNIALIEIDRRIFQLNPQNDQIALRIALFLTEHWRMQAKTRQYTDPIMMQDVLTASMVPVDKTNLTTRFIPRVEAAIRKLKESGIVGDAHPLSQIDRTQTRWGKEWLQVQWSFLPPIDLLRPMPALSSEEHYHALPLLTQHKEENTPS
jgi:hypothetical protein